MFESKAQLFPPSSDRYNPDFFFSDSTIAKTRFEFTLETLIPILPKLVGSPSVNLVQVSPSSTDFQSEEPLPPLDTVQGNLRCSQAAAYNIRGLFMSIDNEAIPVLSLIYKTFFQCAPPSVLLKTPRSLLGPCTVPCAPT